MARLVQEVMNAELFAVRDAARTEDVLEALLEYGITAVPVLDDEGRPLGVASLRDLVRPESAAALRSVVAVKRSATIHDAAELMAKSGLHHLVVLDDDGRACGMVSSLDLLRALVGLPPAHPATFPHRDSVFGVTWTDPLPLTPENATSVPDGPGVLVLSVGGTRRTERDVWVETSAALRPRVAELIELPHADTPALARVLAMRDLRFRCASVHDAVLREAIVSTMRRSIDGPSLPRGAAPASSFNAVGPARR